MRIEQQTWMKSPGVVAVFAALSDVRFVGGCVRDALLKRPVADVDMATPLTPDQVIERLEAAHIRAIPTGLKHGTITAIAGVDRQPIEITTLRRDVETDGRHATVAYTLDWAEDAARRDLTVNAMYADADGGVIDFHGGIADLQAGRVRFVGDPEQRIREDYLRLLRFFRFFAVMGRGPADQAALSACTRLAPKMAALSAERVTKELLALLAANDPMPALRLMLENGILAHVAPCLSEFDRLSGLVDLEARPDPIRRLAALIPGGRKNTIAATDRLRLSNADCARVLAVSIPPVEVGLEMEPAAVHRCIYTLGRQTFEDALWLQWAEDPKADCGKLLEQAGKWVPPVFPVGGRDALNLGAVPGPELGVALAAVEKWWVDGDFKADVDACLAQLRRRLTAR